MASTVSAVATRARSGARALPFLPQREKFGSFFPRNLLKVSATTQPDGGAHPEKMGASAGSGAQADGGAHPEKMGTSAGSGALPREICF